ncbi:Splicing factor 3B subunit 1 [Hordeum vulgare]|nr:Splicing factor 3B subunit 1 [Hordeum vulgare]
MKLRQAGNGLRKLWDVEVAFDTDGSMYLDRGWKQFVRAYDLRHGYFLVFRYDDNATFAVKMTIIINMDFPELAHMGLNNLTWASGYEIFLNDKRLLRAVGKGGLVAPTDAKFTPENAQALHFLHHYLCPTLKDEYVHE